MSFDDSMMDDGFIDPAEYMNYLESEAGRMMSEDADENIDKWLSPPDLPEPICFRGEGGTEAVPIISPVAPGPVDASKVDYIGVSQTYTSKNGRKFYWLNLKESMFSRSVSRSLWGESEGELVRWERISPEEMKALMDERSREVLASAIKVFAIDTGYWRSALSLGSELHIPDVIARFHDESESSAIRKSARRLWSWRDDLIQNAANFEGETGSSESKPFRVHSVSLPTSIWTAMMLTAERLFGTPYEDWKMVGHLMHMNNQFQIDVMKLELSNGDYVKLYFQAGDLLNSR